MAGPSNHMFGDEMSAIGTKLRRLQVRRVAIAFGVAFIAAILFLTQPASAGMLSVARSYVGMHERTNNAALRKVIGVNPAKTKWCGYFMTAVARKAGVTPPAGSARAISWRAAGRSVKMSAIQPGDILVMRGHVTIFTKRANGRVCGIGGNQSNQVRESCYSSNKIVSVRRI